MNGEDEYSSALRGFQEKRVMEDSVHADTADESQTPDLSGLSGPPGELLGLPEFTPTGLHRTQIGPPRLPSDFSEKDRPSMADFKVATVGVELDVAVSFMVRTIQCDNYTSQWLFVDNVGRYVPPLTLGWACGAPQSSQKIHVKWAAPPGVSQPPDGSGGLAQAVFTLLEKPTDGVASGAGFEAPPPGLVPGSGGASAQVTRQTNESSALLAGNATFNGATIDTGNNTAAAAGWSKFRVLAYSDVAGTINIQQSRDGITWRTTVTQAVGAASATVAESIIARRYVRASYTNGAAAQATFELDSVLVSI